MTNAEKAQLLRGLHTAIYAVMTLAVLAALYAGLSGATGLWLWLCVGLVGLESAVFVGNGFACPFTAMIATYGAAHDTYLPERFTRHTLHVFCPLVLLAFVLLGARWLGLTQ